MPVHMKMLRTRAKVKDLTFLDEEGGVFRIPKNILDTLNKYKVTKVTQAEKFKKKLRWELTANPGEVFADLNKKYSKLGALVKGIRARENLSQKDFAAKINISQSDLSKIENGKRSIGKIVATRIIKKFKLNRNLFN